MENTKWYIIVIVVFWIGYFGRGFDNSYIKQKEENGYSNLINPNSTFNRITIKEPGENPDRPAQSLKVIKVYIVDGYNSIPTEYMNRDSYTILRLYGGSKPIIIIAIKE